MTDITETTPAVADLLARALAEGFAFQGEVMRYSGHRRGQPSANLPPTAFISFIQNHDHIGNRAFGERIGALAPPPVVRAIAAVYLLLPGIPMLFMGGLWIVTLVVVGRCVVAFRQRRDG